jgi:phosphohistidine phosphatase
MFNLFLVRHAKSDRSSGNIADIDRPLNDRGYHDAYHMSGLLKEKGISPDLIISSSAIRAASTAFIFSRTFSYAPGKIVFTEDLYETSVKAYISVITKKAGKFSNIFLFAHNPIITDLCNTLSTKFIENMPTCAVAGIRLSRDLKKGKGELFLYDFPKSLANE